MKKTVFSLIIILTCITYTTGQRTISNVTGELSDINRFRSAVKILKEIKPDSIEIDGTPFLNPLFLPGDIINSNGDVYKNIPLRYNIYNENFEFEKEGIPFVLPTSDFALSVVLDDRTFLFMNYEYKGSQTGYLEQIVEGKNNLFKLYRMAYEPPTEEVAYQDAKKGRFRMLKSELLLSKNGETPIVVQSQKQLRDQFPEIEEDLKTVIKRGKLKVNQEEDLIEVVKYINSK